jgi:glucose/arabinose dehydrogenase
MNRLICRANAQVTSGYVGLLLAGALSACSAPAPVTSEAKSQLVTPPGFIFEDVVTGLDQSVAFDFAPDGRMYIAEKPGVVRVFENGALAQAPFIDIRDEVLNFSDRGLESVVVHPQFPEQPFIYVYFIFDPFSIGQTAGPDSAAEPPTVVQVRRYTADVATDFRTAVPGSGVTIVGANGPSHIGTPSCQTGDTFVNDCIPMDQNFHTGGMLKFGKDGALFITTGDGYENVFNPNKPRTVSADSFAGKLLRVNALTGEGLSDNPFFDGDATSNRSKVFSLGLRNPWRMALSPFSGDPVIGDVGWDTWEEINTGRGKNFGWPCYEGGDAGSLVQPGWESLNLPACVALYNQGIDAVTAPLYAYNHNGQGAAVILGDFYTGAAFPPEFKNALFFSDFNLGWLKYLTFDAQGGSAVVHDFATETGAIVQLSQGPDTNLYFARVDNGTIGRIRYTNSGNTPPHALLSATPFAGVAPLEVSFSAAGSTDADLNALTYAWDFGDGETGSGLTVTHTYTQNQTYVATLSVSDGTDTTTITKNILVGNAPPVAKILTPAAGSHFPVGSIVSFSGEGTDAEDGELAAAKLAWSGIMHHNDHVHYDAVNALGASGEFEFDDHEDNSWLELCLTATDSIGLSATSCVDLHFSEVSYTFVTVPAGLDLVYNGQRRQTPFTVQMYVNSERGVAAPEPQGSSVWSAWSDGGERVHTVKALATPKTLTATFLVGTIPTQGLVHHWPLETDANDIVGNVNGTLHNGVALVKDPERNLVLGCDGSDDQVSMDNPLTATFSLSAWVRSAQVSPQGAFAWQGNGLIWSDVGGDANDFTLATLNNSVAVFDGATPGGQNATNGKTLINDDAWHHLAIVRNADSKTLSIYVDGALDATGVAGTAVLNANPTLYFCGNMVDNRYFGGRLDDVRQYDRALTNGEIAALAARPITEPRTGPVHRWSLDTDANDSLGTANGTLHNGAALVSDAARGQVLSCDGVDDHVSMSNPLPATFTLSGWLATKQTSPQGNFGWQGNGLIWSDVGGDANDFTLATLNDKLAVFDGAAPGGQNATNGNVVLNDGGWHHFAIVRNAGTKTLSIYVDGVLDNTGIAGTAVLNANPTLYFCGNVLDNRYFAGLLDDVLLFDSALAADEIAALAVPELPPDAGVDAGHPVVPSDGGASTHDAGAAHDAGGSDAATPAHDASTPIMDATLPAPDASARHDASQPVEDASSPQRDAGMQQADAGVAADSGVASPQDAGTKPPVSMADAGTPGENDAGTGHHHHKEHCSVSSVHRRQGVPSSFAWLAGLAVALVVRRRSRS